MHTLILSSFWNLLKIAIIFAFHSSCSVEAGINKRCYLAATLFAYFILLYMNLSDVPLHMLSDFKNSAVRFGINPLKQRRKKILL